MKPFTPPNWSRLTAQQRQILDELDRDIIQAAEYLRSACCFDVEAQSRESARRALVNRIEGLQKTREEWRGRNADKSGRQS